jgi:ADP-ribose pyrophosphatase
MASQRPKAWKSVGTSPPEDYGIFTVRSHRAVDPRDGSEHPRVVIEAPDWVNVIPITEDNRVVMIRQFRFGIGANTLEIPGGIVDPGESPALAAARELGEETGYQGDPLIHLATIHPNPAYQTNRCHSFLAPRCRKTHEGRRDAGEDIAVELYALFEIPVLILSGEITHSLVLNAFFFQQLRGVGV